MVLALARMVEAHTMGVVRTTRMPLDDWPVGVVRSLACKKERACAMAQVCMKAQACAMAPACMMELACAMGPAYMMEVHSSVAHGKHVAVPHHRIRCHNPQVAHLAQHTPCRAVPTT